MLQQHFCKGLVLSSQAVPPIQAADVVRKLANKQYDLQLESDVLANLHKVADALQQLGEGEPAAARQPDVGAPTSTRVADGANLIATGEARQKPKQHGVKRSKNQVLEGQPAPTAMQVSQQGSSERLPSSKKHKKADGKKDASGGGERGNGVQADKGVSVAAGTRQLAAASAATVPCSGAKAGHEEAWHKSKVCSAEVGNSAADSAGTKKGSRKATDSSTKKKSKKKEHNKAQLTNGVGHEDQAANSKKKKEKKHKEKRR